MALSAADDTADIPVIKEDQEKINEFSCLSIQLREDEEQLTQLKVRFSGFCCCMNLKRERYRKRFDN